MKAIKTNINLKAKGNKKMILLKKHYLTMDEFAEISKVSRQRISQYIKAGQIEPEPLKFGKSYAIKTGSIIKKKTGRGKGKKQSGQKKEVDLVK